MFPATNKLRRADRRFARRGTITVLAAFLSMVVLGMVAFSVDFGYVLSARQELQRTADSAAMAACWEFGKQTANGVASSTAITAGRNAASAYALQNVVANVNPAINQNSANSSGGDLVFGYLSNVYSPGALDTCQTSKFNAVTVKVRRDASLNGEAPFFFAKIFGRTGQGLEATATAAYVRNVKGFRAPGGSGNLNLLPFALDVETWNQLMAGSASDSYAWNASTKTISSGADGVKEVNLFPQGTGSPGNRGTVDIGGCNNSTADIARQILYGVSPADLAHFGGELKLDSNNELDLNGDTGISAGVKDELAAIKGQPRMIPIFSTVVGPGNNAQYTIVKWAGIRIMDVKLTGAMSQKHVTIQPCPFVAEGAIPSTQDTSSYVVTPIVLVR